MIANSVSKLQNECSNDNKFCFNFRITTLHHKASIFLDRQGEATCEITGWVSPASNYMVLE